MKTAAEMVATPELAARDFGGRASLWWTALVVGLGLLGLAHVAYSRGGAISDYFLVNEDLLLLGLATAVVLGLSTPSARLGVLQTRHLAAFTSCRARVLSVGAAVIVTAVAYVGWYLVCQQYPLSMDEFWATFDAASLHHLRLAAPVPPEWQPFAFALQPNLRADLVQHSVLVSTYLPMNAVLRAVFGVLGVEPLTGPLCAGASVVLVYSLARRWWPERPDAAFVSAALLATSSQLVITAMTPYAMSAHLVFNLAWLWFFGLKSWPSQVAAVATAFVATGLHQFIFHPLFAAPFVLQLWLQKRWTRAGFHTLAYGALGLFWASYWRLILPALGLTAAAHGLQGQTATHVASDLVAAIDPIESAGLMALNLLRLIAWQNPLAIVLALGGAALAWRDKQALPLLAGIMLTTAAMAALLPFQGNGWGYRYLHGLLGNVCLLAGFAWIRLPATEVVARRAWLALAACIGFSTLVALPIRAYQVFDYEKPFAAASAAIRAAAVDVVLVDATGVWYGRDLVRNDPTFASRPKVMNLASLDDEQIGAICSRYRTAIFDQRDARRFGMIIVPAAPSAAALAQRRLLSELHCATAVSYG